MTDTPTPLEDAHEDDDYDETEHSIMGNLEEMEDENDE